MASTVARAYNEGLGAEPPVESKAEPLVRGPLEEESILAIMYKIYGQRKEPICSHCRQQPQTVEYLLHKCQSVTQFTDSLTQLQQLGETDKPCILRARRDTKLK